MEKIIEKLFGLRISEEGYLFSEPGKENLTEENRLYEFLYDNLEEEKREVFVRYVREAALGHGREVRAAYMEGFKTAVRLGIESLRD